MKKGFLLMLNCMLFTLLSAQVQPKPTKTDGISAQTTSQKPLSEADQLDREYLLKTYTVEGDQAFQKGDYQKALKSYRRIQSLNPSPANGKKLLDCQRAIHKNTPPRE